MKLLLTTVIFLAALTGTTRAHAQAGGTVTDVQAISGPTKGGLREEAIRVIKASGKWVPAMENGASVNSYKKIPLEFKLEVSR